MIGCFDKTAVLQDFQVKKKRSQSHSHSKKTAFFAGARKEALVL